MTRHKGQVGVHPPTEMPGQADSAMTADGANLDHHGGVRLASAFAVALALEAALLLGGVAWIAPHTATEAPNIAPMQIAIVAEAPPAPPALTQPVATLSPPASRPQPASPPLVPTPDPDPTPPPPPIPRPPVPPPPAPREPLRPRVVRAVRRPPPHEQVPPPEAHAQPLAATQPPAAAAPPPSAPAPSADALSAFESATRMAVQSALAYPAAARMADEEGQARVAFDYFDGRVTNITLVRSSGFPVLDRAALATVTAAHYPSPPAELEHRLAHLSVLVTFHGEGSH